MQPEWANQTLVHPVGLALLFLMGAALFMGPRRMAPLAFMVIACFTARQRVVLGGMDFDFLRLLVVIGWARVMTRGEWAGFRWVRLDSLFLLYSIVAATMYVVQQQSSGAVTAQLGQLMDNIGGYFLLRCLIRSWGDVYFIAKGVAVLAAPVAAFFLFEKFTGRNLFAAFGGVSPQTAIRGGRLRAQGAFAHPILAGSFWAALLPIMAGIWWLDAKSRVFAVLGGLSALFIVYASSSSTPLAAVATACVGAAMFPLRMHMRTVRWTVVVLAVIGHMVKTKPIWHIFVYANIIGGSTGWHRYHLIDAAIRRFPEWWLMGVHTTEHWGVGLWDVTNQYIIEGVRGGLITMVCFFLVVIRAFGDCGRLWRRWRHDRRLLYMSWAIGVSLFVHATVFLSVSYFGQIKFLWLLTLAIIASLSAMPPANGKRRRARAARGSEPQEQDDAPAGASASQEGSRSA